MPRHHVAYLATISMLAFAPTLGGQDSGSVSGDSISAAQDVPRPAKAKPRRRLSTRIEAEEIRSGEFHNAYELVQALRPRWLRVRAVTLSQSETVRVEVDGIAA